MSRKHIKRRLCRKYEEKQIKSNVYDFSVDYDALVINDISDIQ